MSASNENPSIFMHDTPNQIKNKVNKHAFSGGQETAEEQRRLGGNPDVDVAYHTSPSSWTTMQKWNRSHRITEPGKMLTGELKQKTISVLQKVVANFHRRKRRFRMS